MKKTTYRRVKSFGKIEAILAFLSNQKEPVSGQDVADGTGMEYGTVMGYLATLEDANWVASPSDGQYQLGLALAVFWARVKVRTEAELERMNMILGVLGQEG